MFNIYRQIMTAVTILSALIVPIFISSCDAIDKKNTKANNTVPDNGGDNTVPDNGGDNTVPYNYEQPNIVFVYIDDLGWVDTWDSDFYKTPNLDKFRKQSLSFNRAYAMPLCAPSRAALMSGLYSLKTGIYQVGLGARKPSRINNNSSSEYTYLEPRGKDRLETEFYTIAESLKTQNYQTVHLGKWHLSSRNSPKVGTPLDQGFDVNYGGNHHHSPPNKGKDHGYYANDNGKYPSLPNLGTVAPKTYLTDHLAQLAMEWMQTKRNPKNPFFMYFSHFAVHTPMQVKEQDKQAILSQSDGVNLYDKPCPINKNSCWNDLVQCDEGQKHCNVTYAAMLKNLDDNFGKLMQYLENTPADPSEPQGDKLIDNTMVVFYSDNGGFASVSSQKPLLGNKGNTFEGGIRVPLMVRWDRRIIPDTKTNIPVINVDFFPTLNAIAGIDYNDKTKLYNAKVNKYRPLDGVDISPILFNRPTKNKLRERSLFWHYPMRPKLNWNNQPTSVVIRDNFKLIYSYLERELLLYDLDKDPYETTNLIEDPKFETTAQSLLTELNQWVESGDGTLLPKASFNRGQKLEIQRVPQKLKI